MGNNSPIFPALRMIANPAYKYARIGRAGSWRQRGAAFELANTPAVRLASL